MPPIPAARYAVFALTTLALGGCYYTSPYGYAPYYAPAPATLTQREIPVTPAAPGSAASSQGSTAVAPPVADPAPVYVAPAYPPPYPYPYPYYAPAYYPGWYGWGAPARNTAHSRTDSCNNSRRGPAWSTRIPHTSRQESGAFLA
ncbi:hypothetical protein, partial [Burkholderia cepacia]|uniref:hypothetical protein n=1 Tax=Burkholderia cepacia TaxID=292 RepID=UPI001FB898B1